MNFLHRILHSEDYLQIDIVFLTQEPDRDVQLSLFVLCFAGISGIYHEIYACIENISNGSNKNNFYASVYRYHAIRYALIVPDIVEIDQLPTVANKNCLNQR